VLLAPRRWVWAPVRRMPLQHRHRWHRALPMTRRDLARADPARAHRAVPGTTTSAHLVVPADLADKARAGPADLGTSTRTDLVVRADPAVPGTSIRTDPVAPGTSTPVARAGRAGLVAHGMEMPSVATSAGPRGVTDPPPGDRVSHRGRTGTDRSHRRAATGGTAQSTTGATRKRRFGTPGSTRGASGSSGSGSRCKEASSHGARLATRRGGRRRWRDGRAVLRSQAVLP
jgi:hypothetical protein